MVEITLDTLYPKSEELTSQRERTHNTYLIKFNNAH